MIVLHPRHKLTYFRNAGWEESWIDTAKKIVRDEYDRSYAFMDVDVDGPPQAVSTSTDNVWYTTDTVLQPPNSVSQSQNIFDNLPALAAPAPSELRDEHQQTVHLVSGFQGFFVFSEFPETSKP